MTMGFHSSLPQEEDEDEDEDDHDEFFETSEDIASSSSDADSVGEGNYSYTPQIPSSSSSSSSASKYEIWKGIPGSIAERRQRLHAQMGLIHGASSSSSSSSSPTGSVGSSVTVTDRPVCVQKEQLNNGRGGAHVRELGESFGLNIVRSMSEGGLEEAEEEEEEEEEEGHGNGFLSLAGNVKSSSESLVKSRIGSPLRIHFNQASRPFLVDKENRLRKSRDAKEKNLDSNTSDSEASGKSMLAGRSSSEGGEEESSRAMMGSGAIGAGTPATPDVVDGFCRIKDLDSGKEFVVNEVGKDGLWNRLKVLDTGVEMSLAEFESCLGLSPIVQEVMRREKAAEGDLNAHGQMSNKKHQMTKKKKNKKKKKNRGETWLKAIKWAVGGPSSCEVSHHHSCPPSLLNHHGSGSDERDTSTEKSRRSGSTTYDGRDVGQPVKVSSNKKAIKEFAGLHQRQEIQAHEGAIWAMRFSHDGSLLATAGQDKVVRIWEVVEQSSRSKDSPYSSGELDLNAEKIDCSYQQSGQCRSMMRCKLFRLWEMPKCSFHGHTEDVLDLSWSPSQFLLSSSMDKTVRLWSVSTRGCLKVFKHNDYVTCVQFHPLDDGHFISGSLDGKVRIWRIKEPQVVDWVDLQEMVTAACYTPNGQGALVGSYKGTCRFYGTSENKLELDTTFEMRKKGKRSHGKKITGFQFIPGDKEKVLITSSDSRIRLYDGTEIISKYKGFKNVKTQIAASFVPNGQYIICGSEDSRVYIWKYADSVLEDAGRQRKLSSYSYEHFTSKHVLVAISWPGRMTNYQPKEENSQDRNMAQAKLLDHGASSYKLRISSKESESEGVDLGSMTGMAISPRSGLEHTPRVPTTPRNLMPNPHLEDCCASSMLPSCISTSQSGNGKTIFFADSKGLATWPEEKLPSFHQSSTKRSISFPLSSLAADGNAHDKPSPATGLVIVTASLEGDIRIFQNLGSHLR